MKYYLLLLPLFLLACSGRALSQTPSADIVTGKTYQLASAALGDTVTIQVSVPAGYNESMDKYPVLYLLDGQWFFPHGLSVRSDYTQRNGQKVVPDFIVVGITTGNDKRWEWTMERTADFLKFLEGELLPFVDDNLRTTQERLLFGWETAGGFVIKALSQSPGLFEGFIAASPAPLYGAYFGHLKPEHEQFSRFLSSYQGPGKFLYIGQGEADYPVAFGTAALDSLLTKQAPDQLKWEHEIITGTSHELCAYATLQRGLRSFYHHYHYLIYHSKAQFDRLGGLAYVDRFYEERARKLNLTDDDGARHATRRNLTHVAITENDYEWFDFLMESFKKDSLLEKSFAPHLSDYVQFCLRNERPQKAFEIASFLTTRHPDHAQGLNGMGDVYLALGEWDKAEQFYKKAIRKAEETDDWRIGEYRADLEKLGGQRDQ